MMTISSGVQNNYSYVEKILESGQFVNETHRDYTTCTICPGSSDPFYIVSYYLRWVTTSWTHSM